ncbi:hypothetical protein CAOG_08958, partial [Capsaspora owczarzaki ATCC 30864]|uniref:hypothetical protein n=1 Tax=Capsaspora owczarzaki (strain ATCC 30864) TaxID=595528 RepID=UPI0003521EEA
MNRFRLTLSGSFAVATTIHYIRQDFIRLKNLPSNTVVPVVVTLDEVSMLLGQTVDEKFDREFSTLPQWRQERRFIKWAIAPLRELSNSGGKVTLFMSGTRPFALSDAVQVDMFDKVTGSRFFASLIEMPRLSGAASAQLATRRNNNAAWHRDVWKTLLLQRALGIPRQINNIFTTDNRSMPITIDPKSLIAFVRAIAFKSTLDDWADARIDRLVDLGLCFWTSLSQYSFSQQLMLNLHFLDLVKLDDDQCAYGHIASKLLTELQTIGKMSQPETVNDNAVSLPSHNWEQIVPRLLNLRLLVELCDACAKTKGAPQAADLTLPLPTLFEGAVLSDDLQSVMVVLRQFERAVDSIPDGFSLTRVNEEFSDLNASFVSVNGLDVAARLGQAGFKCGKSTVSDWAQLHAGHRELIQSGTLDEVIELARSTRTKGRPPIFTDHEVDAIINLLEAFARASCCLTKAQAAKYLKPCSETTSFDGSPRRAFVQDTPSRSWWATFLKRAKGRVRLRKGRVLEVCRAAALTPDNLGTLPTQLKQAYDQHPLLTVEPSRVSNFDESEISSRVKGSTVLGASWGRVALVGGGHNNSLGRHITGVFLVCADGTAPLPPMLIFTK